MLEARTAPVPYKVFFTGDVTARGMFGFLASIPHLLKGERLIGLMLAPHHGSHATSMGVSKDDPEDIMPKGVLDKFLLVTWPQRIIISAGKHSHHGHPNKEFMKTCHDIMAAHQMKPLEEHTVYLYRLLFNLIREVPHFLSGGWTCLYQ